MWTFFFYYQLSEKKNYTIELIAKMQPMDIISRQYLIKYFPVFPPKFRTIQDQNNMYSSTLLLLKCSTISAFFNRAQWYWIGITKLFFMILMQYNTVLSLTLFLVIRLLKLYPVFLFGNIADYCICDHT